MIDLLVVGGGPAGLATAIHAVRAGLDVAVAEPRETPVDKACGEGLMPTAVGRLRTLGVEPAGRPFAGIRYVAGRRCVDAAFRDGPGLGVRRTGLHAALARRAGDLGVEVRDARVTDLRQHADHVRVGGVDARYVVAADGLHSTVRRLLGLDPAPVRAPRYGLRRHFDVAPWSRHVEVHWSPRAEAYVTPLADSLVGVALLTGDRGSFAQQLQRFPALAQRLPDAGGDDGVRGAGPLRQHVRTRVAGRVLLVGDAAGYVDALTGEGIAVALAGAEAAVGCIRHDRVQDYEHAWRRASRTYRLLTGSLLWARNRPVLAPRIVPAAERLPWLFSAAVNALA
ncbi:MAG: NAD(P)/FAD-dependent oxidoreductase [Streptosporangiales bacterium]|nr:NAD(P)/FAD-dependent oxidoreductase [Streptosporangiales bacterium]MBO0889541.1 NAD(P)/FAD-dependent oxidoreductase [Acidothermales bacterium]